MVCTVSCCQTSFKWEVEKWNLGAKRIYLSELLRTLRCSSSKAEK